MIKNDDRNIKRFERDLKTFAAKSFPFATKNTLNAAAFATQKTAKVDVRNSMTLRNRFTEQSIRVEQTKTLNVRHQASKVGSTAGYMEDQEFGAFNTKKGKEGIPIATSYSAGQGDNAQPRTRLPRKANKLASIQLSKRRRAKSRKQANLFKVQDAVTTGRRFVFLHLTRKKGIFKVIGGRKKFSRGWPKGAKLRMVWDLTETSTRIPKNPWLAPSVNKTEKQMPALYLKSLEFQAKRQGLFK